MNLDRCISESKSIVRRYLNTPMAKVPDNDKEKLNVAWMVVQAALGTKKFRDFLRGIET